MIRSRPVWPITEKERQTMIKNIFLDAGGVILDETEFEEKSAIIITEIIGNYKNNYTFEDYWHDIDEAVYRFVPKVYDYILFKHIKNHDDFKKVKIIYKEKLNQSGKNFKITEGLKDFLIQFSSLYKIGILGQYGAELREYLETKGMLHYFTYTVTQEKYTITKPDPGYFRAILNDCNCIAGQSIMIGDRIDKDIIPAKLTGMKTIRLKTGIHKNQEPRTPDEIPDYTFAKLGDITEKTIRTLDHEN